MRCRFFHIRTDKSMHKLLSTTQSCPCTKWHEHSNVSQVGRLCWCFSLRSEPSAVTFSDVSCSCSSRSARKIASSASRLLQPRPTSMPSPTQTCSIVPTISQTGKVIPFADRGSICVVRRHPEKTNSNLFKKFTNLLKTYLL